MKDIYKDFDHMTCGAVIASVLLCRSGSTKKIDIDDEDDECEEE